MPCMHEVARLKGEPLPSDEEYARQHGLVKARVKQEKDRLIITRK